MRLILWFSILGTALCYEFDLLFQTKCVMENVADGYEVTGSFTAYNKHDPSDRIPVDFKVRVLA